MRSYTYVRAVVAAICIAVPLMIAPPSMAASPTGGVSSVDVTGAGTASVRTFVNPQGSQTSAHLEWGVASSNFCTSFGVDASGKNFSIDMTGGDHTLSIVNTGRAATGYVLTVSIR